MRGIQLAV